MTEKPQNFPSDAIDKTGEFFSVGPPLHAVKPGYVRRAADDILYQTLVAGNYAHVIAPARTGKSSLIAATSARLQNNGFKVAVLNLSQIAERAQRSAFAAVAIDDLEVAGDQTWPDRPRTACVNLRLEFHLLADINRNFRP